MKKTILNAAVATALTAVVSAPANAAINQFNWDGFFTMLDAGGAGLANTSITAKGANQYQTPVTGTMAFDTVTGAGTATLVPFDFFAGTAPAEAVGITMQAIGDGAGGPGTLVLGNMLFNWNGNNGIPVSLILDAQGFFAGDLGGGGLGAVPASDGTYIDATWGYLGVGPVPIATTEWNTSFAPGCSLGNCMGVSPSGFLPLVVDTASNANEYLQGDGVGIGGNPMSDGPFQGFNANFDVTLLTPTGQTSGTIGPFPVSAVPVPAAVWLFGSGLLGLVGVARRRKS